MVILAVRSSIWADGMAASQKQDDQDLADIVEVDVEAAESARSDSSIDERYMVPGLSRGLALLQLFTRQEPEQKLTEIAEKLGLSRSATYRIVYTLEKDGFLLRDAQTRRYRLSAKILTLGFEFLHAQPLTDMAPPFLRRLSDQCGTTSYLTVLDGWEVVHLARSTPTAALITNLPIGARFPAHAVPSGRAIISYLDERELLAFHKRLLVECKRSAVPAFKTLHKTAQKDLKAGHVFARSLFEPSITACSAAVRDRSGAAVGALTIVGPHSAFDQGGGEGRLGDIVAAIAAEFSTEIGFNG